MDLQHRGSPPSPNDSSPCARSLALNLDIDLIRGQLGGWLNQPTEAGLAARALAISMIDTHLCSGRDVVVPQFLARPDFIDQLQRAATRANASFVEITLQLTKEEAASACESRRRNPTRSTHQDAADLVDRADTADPFGEMHDALQLFLDERENTHGVEVDREDIDSTFATLVHTLAKCGVNWQHPNPAASNARSRGAKSLRSGLVISRPITGRLRTGSGAPGVC